MNSSHTMQCNAKGYDFRFIVYRAERSSKWFTFHLTVLAYPIKSFLSRVRAIFINEIISIIKFVNKQTI